MQEQKINTTEFERERFMSLRLRIFLTAIAPAGVHKHDPVQSIFDFSERPIYEFKVCVYF